MDGYWVMEYGKVLCGYLFLMFVWPTAVFWDYLKNRDKIFYFSFCVTVQVVVVNTVILMMGLFHILDRRWTAGLFYGIFLLALFQKRTRICTFLSGNYKERFEKLRAKLRHRMGEWVVLSLVLIFGMIYFSYGAFQIHSYGQYDLFIHHDWISSLMEGKIFSDGVYPQAMHCFVYCLSVLFGIRLYSIMLFLQGIHVSVFLLSAYCLLREVFYWRYSPLFVLCLYLTLDFVIYHSMSRLQAALPMEFGLHTQFLCGQHLLRYFKSEKSAAVKGRVLKGCWNEHLLGFMMSLSASIAIHCYTTVMAFILCASFALFHLKEILCPKRFFPLVFAVTCGCLAAAAPMTGGLAQGIPLEGSIHWALNAVGIMESGDNAELPEKPAGEETVGSPLELSSRDREVIEKLPDIGQKVMKAVITAEYLAKAVYQKGYRAMYWDKDGGRRGSRICLITLGIVLFLLTVRLRKQKKGREIGSRYFPVILISFLSVLIFTAFDSPELGLPVLIADHRYCSTGHLMILAVMIIPADLFFKAASHVCRDRSLQAASCITAACIYVFTCLSGAFHGYLFHVMFRYDAAAKVTESIRREFSEGSYTVVSPKEEAYQLASHGEHKEISAFIRACDSTHYRLSTEYVFLYVEKKPLVYFQYYYFHGPSWLAKSGNAAVEAEKISKEAAEKEFLEKDSLDEFYAKNRTVLESKAYEWCQCFSRLYPSVLKTYYEDHDFVCYFFRQNPEQPYDLSVGGKG